MTAIIEIIADVKPADCGLIEESWIIGRIDGRLACWSDVPGASPSIAEPDYVESVEAGREYWEEAAEAYRSTIDLDA